MFQGLLLLLQVTYIDAVCRINYLYLSSYPRVYACYMSRVGWLIRTVWSCWQPESFGLCKKPKYLFIAFSPPLLKKALYKPAFFLEKVCLHKLCKH